MASLVIVQKKKEAARRQRVAEMKRDHKRFVDEILGRWGHDGKKELEFDSLKAWLTSVNKGVEPSDDETKWVMAMANQGHTENGTTFASMERKSVLADDLEKALSAWMSYKDSCPEIEEVFKKFDPNGDKILDRAELALLLTDLNQGQEPAESEVDWVLKEADVIGQGAISKPCLAKAVSLWYTMVEDVDHPARDNSRKSLGKESLGTSAREVGGTPLPARARRCKKTDGRRGSRDAESSRAQRLLRVQGMHSPIATSSTPQRAQALVAGLSAVSTNTTAETLFGARTRKESARRGVRVV